MSEEEKISPEEFPQEQPACTAGEIQETINQLQTENMEVHHHPNVEKKNVKEYFLEFLMIFLAVTMGFFAEQIREHYIEIKREKHSMISLVKDLESDTMQLSNIKIYHKAKLEIGRAHV